MVFRSNLETLGDKWRQEWRAEGLAAGRAAGRAEGRAEGLVKGKADALVCLLAKRFGAVGTPLRKRIRAANLATLDCWFERAITAPDLPSVFARAPAQS